MDSSFTTSKASTILKPVAYKERMHILDVLRGFAILGIFLANLKYLTGFGFLSPQEQPLVAGASANEAGTFFLHFLFEGKFYSLFSLLFGVGFAILYLRTQAKGKAFLPLYMRRIGWLFLFGLVHAFLIWPGDILAVYALTALLLIPFRNAGNRTLLISAGVLLLSPLLFYVYMMVTGNVLGEFLAKIAIPFAKVWPTPGEAIMNGTYSDLLKTNFIGTLFRYSDLFFTSRFPKVLGMFLIGFYLGRNNYFADLYRHKRIFKKILIYGGVMGIIFSLIMAVIMHAGIDFWPLGINGFILTVAYALGVHSLALAYVATFTLLFIYFPTRKYLLWLAPAGRMALTNYIMQSCIAILIFYNIGFGLGPVGPLYWIPFGIAVFLLQVQFSRWWFRYFRFGPLEWLWRSLIYRRKQQFKAAPAVSPL